jgi:hypothetical protein
MDLVQAGSHQSDPYSFHFGSLERGLMNPAPIMIRNKNHRKELITIGEGGEHMGSSVELRTRNENPANLVVVPSHTHTMDHQQP